jgi:hypothetical protein
MLVDGRAFFGGELSIQNMTPANAAMTAHE